MQEPVGRLFAPSGPLSRAKPGYAPREEQVRMARAVARTLAEKGVLLADAPTGTGKSLAHMAPGTLSGEGSGVIVSTATINLQGQFLRDVMWTNY